MKNYVAIALDKGIYHALIELESDVIQTFEGQSKSAASRGMQIARTALHWRIEKLNLGHLFTQEAKEKRMKGDLENGDQKEDSKEDS